VKAETASSHTPAWSNGILEFDRQILAASKLTREKPDRIIAL
jgi:hypothetical protein